MNLIKEADREIRSASRTVRRQAVAVVAAVLIGTGLIAGAVGCGAKNTEPYHDGPRSGVVNRTAADLITMPDGYSNVATKCDHGNRIYVAFKGDANRAAMWGVADDPTCK